MARDPIVPVDHFPRSRPIFTVRKYKLSLYVAVLWSDKQTIVSWAFGASYMKCVKILFQLWCYLIFQGPSFCPGCSEKGRGHSGSFPLHEITVLIRVYTPFDQSHPRPTAASNTVRLQFTSVKSLHESACNLG